MEDRPVELREAARALSTLAPPPGAEERVRRAIVAGIPRRRRLRRIWVGLAFLPAAAGAVSVYRWMSATPPESPPAIAPATRQQQTSRPSLPPPREEPGPQTTPTPVAPAPSIREAPPRTPRRVHPRRKSKPAPVAPREPAPPADPSRLSLEVAAYQRALALQGQDSAAALARWREIRARWPAGTLAHEVDLRLIETLLQLKRLDEARSECQRFLQRYPKSPKADHVRRLIRPAAERKAAP